MKYDIRRLRDLATLRPGETRNDTDYLQTPVCLGEIRALFEAPDSAEKAREELREEFIATVRWIP